MLDKTKVLDPDFLKYKVKVKYQYLKLYSQNVLLISNILNIPFVIFPARSSDLKQNKIVTEKFSNLISDLSLEKLNNREFINDFEILGSNNLNLKNK